MDQNPMDDAAHEPGHAGREHGHPDDAAREPGHAGPGK